jgi:hypothetical protein
MNPSVEVAERLGAQGVETALTVGADSDEPSIVEDPKMPGDPRLADREGRD